MKRTARLASALAGIVAGVALIADAKAVTVDIAPVQTVGAAQLASAAPRACTIHPSPLLAARACWLLWSIKESQVRFSSRFPPVHTPSQMRTRREISQLGTLIPV